MLDASIVRNTKIKMKRLVIKIKNDDETLFTIENPLYVSFSSLDRGTVSDITNWGCFSNKGEVEFIGEESFVTTIENYQNANVCIYYIYKSTEKLLATFLIEDLTFNKENKKIIITLKDELLDWQKQSVDEYYEFEKKTTEDICNEIFGESIKIATNVGNKMFRTIVNTSYMEKSSKWVAADKICQATMLRCFCDNDGTPLISYDTPKQSEVIIIRPRNILGINNNKSAKKTKINDVSISAYNIKKHKNEEISSSSVPFTWYRVTGIDDKTDKIYIIAVWANYFTNVSTLRLETTYGLTGARVVAYIKKPEHLFSFGDAVIEVNEASCADKSTTITTTKKSTKDETFIPDYLSVSELDSDKQTLNVTCSTYNAIDNSGLAEFGLVKYCLTDGTINVLGNFFTEEGQTTFGSSSEFSENLSSNELIQTDSYYVDEYLLSQPLAKHIVDTVISKYSNGVECVEIEVTPSDYYDIDGNKIINTNGRNTNNETKPIFDKYDIVTPYVIKNGVETPYSTKDDGSAKSFRVIGIEYSYKGILRQNLHLQEVV